MLQIETEQGSIRADLVERLAAASFVKRCQGLRCAALAVVDCKLWLVEGFLVGRPCDEI